MLVVLGCGPDAPELRVFAASSLTDAFPEIGSAFERAHPGQRVAFSFAGSQALRLQIERGAPADAFASADAVHVQGLRGAGKDEVFAGNPLVLIVPRDNPAGLSGYADLPRAQRIVVGAPAVPIGRYTRAQLARDPAFAAAVNSRVVSHEHNVRLVRAKVAVGAADAAIVYRSDVDPSVRAFPIPDAVQGSYHAAAVTPRGQTWVDFLRTPQAQAILARHGFSPP